MLVYIQFAHLIKSVKTGQASIGEGSHPMPLRKFWISITLCFGFLLCLPASAQEQRKKAAKKAAKKVTPVHSCLKPRNPLCNKIYKLNPNIDLDFALKLSDAIIRVGRKHNIPTHLLVSIAKQESNFNLAAVRMVNGLIKQGDIYIEAKAI